MNYEHVSHMLALRLQQRCYCSVFLKCCTSVGPPSCTTKEALQRKVFGSFGCKTRETINMSYLLSPSFSSAVQMMSNLWCPTHRLYKMSGHSKQSSVLSLYTDMQWWLLISMLMLSDATSVFWYCMELLCNIDLQNNGYNKLYYLNLLFFSVERKHFESRF